MQDNKLKLNGEKTEALIVGSKNSLKKVNQDSIQIDGSDVKFVNCVKSLGTIIYSELTMNNDVTKLRKRLLFDLKTISNIRPYITQKSCQKLVTSLKFSKLDYCNSLLFGVSSENIKKLQVIQNHAARLILNKRIRDDATPLLLDLH